jgi:hypothetical protein
MKILNTNADFTLPKVPKHPREFYTITPRFRTLTGRMSFEIRCILRDDDLTFKKNEKS